MSAVPSDEVNVTIDGVAVVGRKGQMIMQVADVHGAYIPRFCYHDKLSIAANCRMCLVEVEKAPKPQPACATPIAEGMKIFTKSPRAIGAQKATMEFLLINHPLDCPICDQGGECELQDLAVGFGRGISRFTERKRSVKDKDLGPLVSTDMTRCIHCTRCVRFGQEIQGFPQLGTAGRGEHMEITTYVQQSVDHELSANIVDLCPVGALNNKPFRYRSRSWEMTQHPLISPHDAVGSNLFGHSLRGRLMRIVPRTNEAINETWISDRDRFGFEGMHAADRAVAPLLRERGELREVDWETALAKVAENLSASRASAHELAFLAAPSSTLEELFLFAQIANHLGTRNIDHRLRQLDLEPRALELPFPQLGLPLADVDAVQSFLIIGADLRAEAPILAHRMRKAVIKSGAKAAFLNPWRLDYLFPIEQYVAADNVARELAGVVRAAAALAGRRPSHLADSFEPSDAQRAMAAMLMQGERKAIILGELAQRHESYGVLKDLAAELGGMVGARVGVLTEGANAAGAYLAGAIPFDPLRAGAPNDASAATSGAAHGLSARAMLKSCRKFILLGAIDPSLDLLDRGALAQADFVVALTPFASAELRELAHVVLPVGTFAETAGTFVNCEGRWQRWSGAAKSLGAARPAWKVLRVLGNLLGIPDFDFDSAEQVRDRVQEKISRLEASVSFESSGTPSSQAPSSQVSSSQASSSQSSSNGAPANPSPTHAVSTWSEIRIYAGDALVRRSDALAHTALAGLDLTVAEQVVAELEA